MMDTLTRRLTLELVLPSEIEGEGFHVRVTNECTVLELVVR